MLVLSAEDYSGLQPNTAPGTGPNHLRSYEDALRAAGIRYDVYDVDAEERTAPDPLGVLGHYRAVLWYTGDDLFVREPGMGAGTGTSKLADDEIIAVRDYLNDGGKLLYTGQNAAFGQLSGFAYNPAGQPPYCAPGGEVPNCVPLSDDFLQYCLGAYLHIDAAATKEEASALPIRSAGGAFGDRPDRAQRRRQRGQPVPRLLDGDHVEHPAGGDLPAVRVRAAPRGATARRRSTRPRARRTWSRSRATTPTSG